MKAEQLRVVRRVNPLGVSGGFLKAGDIHAGRRAPAHDDSSPAWLPETRLKTASMARSVVLLMRVSASIQITSGVSACGSITDTRDAS